MRNILSVGLPVFNEENFLEETLVSILNQSFSEFELINGNVPEYILLD